MLQDAIKVEEPAVEMFPDAKKRIARFELMMQDSRFSISARIENARDYIEVVDGWSREYDAHMSKLYYRYFLLEFRNPKKACGFSLLHNRQLILDQLHQIDKILSREKLELDHYVEYLRVFIQEECSRMLSSLPSVRLFGF